MNNTGIELIAAERKRQIEKEGWSITHDQEHLNNELAWAAVCYAAPAEIRALQFLPIVPTARWEDPWPWGEQWDKRGKHNYLRRLQIAGALIAAEIDRIILSEENVAKEIIAKGN